jgi:hypothetical protein
VDPSEAVEAAWRAGWLQYKLFPYQDQLYQATWRMIEDPECKLGAVNVSRQFGKTFDFCLVGSEFCVRNPGAQVRIPAPTGIDLRVRTLPIMRHILQDCPVDLRPQWRSQDRLWQWPNGSQQHMYGVNDGRADDHRGAPADLAFPDECGYIDDFNYLIESVLLPMTIRTGGTIVGSSTPPKTTAHGYVSYARRCKTSGHYYHATIHDTDLAAEEIRRLCLAAGGEQSVTWRREYLAEFVVDTELQVIPEWSAEYIRECQPSELDKFWHKYTALDIGATRRDFQAVLFGYYDFQRAHLHIRRELIDSQLPRWKTDELAARIRKVEHELWGENAAPRRWADNNNKELLVDLAMAGMPFNPTSKDELPSMVNKVRIWTNAGRISVDPSCKNLINCLEAGIWRDEQWIGREFDRNDDLGHLDALAALIYLVRNIDEATNPIPRTHGFDPHNMAPPRRGFEDSGHLAALRKAFGPKS